MNIETKQISELIPSPYNPRKISNEEYEKLKRSIQEFGYVEPVIWNKATGHVVGGHQRLKALSELGEKEISCVVVDMPEAQEKALNIALNKISGEWDMSKLNELLEDLRNTDIDITLTGFDITIPDDNDDDGGYYGDERDRTFNYYRLYEYDETRVAGYYQFPTLKACHYVPDDLIGFNYVKSFKGSREGLGVHFFLDDYQFERIWSNPYENIERLSGFSCVLTPDFSTYEDMPMAMKIWNIYRSRLIGQLMQDAELQVIPNIRYFGKDTLDFCLDGIEPGGVISFSTVGIYGKNSDAEIRESWITGVIGTIDKLKPECILIYGKKPDYEFSNVSVKYFKSREWERSSK